MEVEKLYQFSLLIIVVGMLLGVGILALDKFGEAAKEASTVYNETIAIASGAGSTTYDDVTAVSYFGNATRSTDDTGGSVNVDVNYTSGGDITVNGSYDDGSWKITYTYDADTTATTAATNTNTELGTIASTWLGLIVTIAVLAIIIMLVMRSFGNRR